MTLGPVNGNAEVLEGFTTNIVVDRIVSDAQSGAARGALDAARDLNISFGGHCAAERLADDGPLHPRYFCHPTKGGFAVRCAKNVQTSNATLLVSLCEETEIDGRTAHARDTAKRMHKASAHLRVFADQPPGVKMVASLQTWLTKKRIRILHVTGPLESREPGLAEATRNLLVAAFGKERF